MPWCALSFQVFPPCPLVVNCSPIGLI
jgi:hypothetical protein